MDAVSLQGVWLVFPAVAEEPADAADGPSGGKPRWYSYRRVVWKSRRDWYRDPVVRRGRQAERADVVARRREAAREAPSLDFGELADAAKARDLAEQRGLLDILEQTRLERAATLRAVRAFESEKAEREQQAQAIQLILTLA